MSDESIRRVAPPIAHHDMPAEEFPLEILLFDEADGQILWSATVTGPGVLKVPGFAPSKVTAVLITGQGQTSITTSRGATFEGRGFYE